MEHDLSEAGYRETNGPLEMVASLVAELTQQTCNKDAGLALCMPGPGPVVPEFKSISNATQCWGELVD